MKKAILSLFLGLVLFVLQPANAVEIDTGIKILDAVQGFTEKQKIKGKKLEKLILNNVITVDYDGKKQSYKFNKDITYEVYEGKKVVGEGTWAIKGLTKSSIKLSGYMDIYFQIYKAKDKISTLANLKKKNDEQTNRKILRIASLNDFEEQLAQVEPKKEKKEVTDKKETKKEEKVTEEKKQVAVETKKEEETQGEQKKTMTALDKLKEKKLKDLKAAKERKKIAAEERKKIEEEEKLKQEEEQRLLAQKKTEEEIKKIDEEIKKIEEEEKLKQEEEQRLLAQKKTVAKADDKTIKLKKTVRENPAVTKFKLNQQKKTLEMEEMVKSNKCPAHIPESQCAEFIKLVARSLCSTNKEYCEKPKEKTAEEIAKEEKKKKAREKAKAANKRAVEKHKKKVEFKKERKRMEKEGPALYEEEVEAILAKSSLPLCKGSPYDTRIVYTLAEDERAKTGNEYFDTADQFQNARNRAIDAYFRTTPEHGFVSFYVTPLYEALNVVGLAELTNWLFSWTDCKGEFILLNGAGITVYVGEWKENVYHGQGTFTRFEIRSQPFSIYNKSFVCFSEEWKYARINGHGTCKYKKMMPRAGFSDYFINTYGVQKVVDMYVGEYKNGFFNGQGTRTWPDGTITKGIWKNDEFIGQQ